MKARPFCIPYQRTCVETVKQSVWVVGWPANLVEPPRETSFSTAKAAGRRPSHERDVELQRLGMVALGPSAPSLSQYFKFAAQPEGAAVGPSCLPERIARLGLPRLL